MPEEIPLNITCLLCVGSFFIGILWAIQVYKGLFEDTLKRIADEYYQQYKQCIERISNEKN
jgi:hypothetical protein